MKSVRMVLKSPIEVPSALYLSVCSWDELPEKM